MKDIFVLFTSVLVATFLWSFSALRSPSDLLFHLVVVGREWHVPVKSSVVLNVPFFDAFCGPY